MEALPALRLPVLVGVLQDQLPQTHDVGHRDHEHVENDEKQALSEGDGQVLDAAHHDVKGVASKADLLNEKIQGVDDEEC